ncbi:Lon protease [Candidatus Fukatsuia symbiotica]|uniref:endopeptidase La n=1 Tax=Candidatus Fukatsuia symbiotica TaxID=1878942 RepID=A0A2U8IAS4_9GAMM|nr:Lon protease [Candidatus Fukatsuia symbiotica]
MKLFCHPQSKSRFMQIKAPENSHYLALITQTIKKFRPQDLILCGGDYRMQDNKMIWQPAQKGDEAFVAKASCLYQEWIEPEQLFGCVRCHKDQISLQPGLIHQVNGGVLVLSVRPLLAQPLMWLRLKQMVIQQRFEWLSSDETRPLPLQIPTIPLDLRLVIVGDRLGLGDFHDIEPELGELSVYGECEAELPLNNVNDMSLWCGYINALREEDHLPPLASDAWAVLFQQAIRYSGDQDYLPLCPSWLSHQLAEALLHEEKQETITANALNISLNMRDWRQNYLARRLQDEIELGQILIQTEGSVVGQINGLSVLEYPGHPRMIGEPTRISCVVHLGDGEFVDVERKVELGGNIHAKGMMIMQAFLISELALEQQQPFSASIVFEQSYGDIDGDSASLAELCALISALSQQPINQQIAVTGSVDQFGNILPIGGVNEKIEGFFEICQRRGLSGTQGVILPCNNVRHLCLHQPIVEAVKNGQFHLWAVSTVAETLPLLTGLSYSDEQQTNLLGIIQERIAQVNMHERRRHWLFRWLNWLR